MVREKKDWTVTIQVYRQKGQEPPYQDQFKIDVNPDEYVLDAVERIWSFHDRTLVYRHACHHSTCGACGMRVNGVEKLTCITPIHEVTGDGQTLKIEPLRNFPVISDLAVDMGLLFRNMDRARYEAVTEVERAPLPIAENTGIRPAGEPPGAPEAERLNDCIECGLCISACPIATTTPSYIGPAVLAALQFEGVERRPELLAMADDEDGVWRCHSAFECTAVCPSFVEPAWRIMDLRKQVLRARFRKPTRPERMEARE